MIWPSIIIIIIIDVAIGLQFSPFFNNRRVRVDVYEGRVAVQWDVRYFRETAPSLEPASIEVRATGDGRGRGAFATQAIPKGTFLGSYEGDILGSSDLLDRYATSDPEYVIRVDANCFLDGRAARRKSSFTPALMNHATAANVVRYCSSRRPPVVDFFADAEIPEGDELCFDYGDAFWRGRAHSMIDLQWFDPDSPENEGVVMEFLKRKYKQQPETFEAAYVAVVLSFLVFLSQLVVRWYKYHVWMPPLDF
ncbi:hypothetical protein CTAYLR_002562 [Chrysophaeum taylorii]|uniref:SET domain-containing protein n=1 Tax=Chrysophaeum taylorii TaxID=2483200 RepID=A0AAD7UF60_9STRA|nr:hypothetical protein CTAYLR_002562 [Chrysophaeum taylorii]